MKFILLTILFFIGCHSFDYSKVKESVSRKEDIFYKADSNPKHRLDLFLPNTNKNFPLVIFIHGGFWRNQDKTFLRPLTGLYHNIGIALAKRGIACIVMSYRLFPETKLDGQVEDVESVIQWANTNKTLYGFKEIFLLGHSAGGHLALVHSLRKSENVKGIIALSPILDIGHMRENKDADFNAELTIPMFGADTKEYAKSSPITFLDSKSVDTLYIFGEKDYDFSLMQSRMLIDKLNATKGKGEVIIIPSYDHAAMVMQINSDSDKITPLVEKYIQRMSK